MSQDLKCPKCHSTDIEEEPQYEYTGGGYANRWIEFICNTCGNEWRGDEKTDYM